MWIAAQARVDRRHVDGLHVVEIAAGDEVADGSAAEVQEAHAERLREAGARIIGRRAADAEDDLLDAALDGVADELASADTWWRPADCADP